MILSSDVLRGKKESIARFKNENADNISTEPVLGSDPKLSKQRTQ